MQDKDYETQTQGSQCVSVMSSFAKMDFIKPALKKV